MAWAAPITSRASRSWDNRSAWVDRTRPVDEPRMSERAYSGYTCSKTIGCISSPPLPGRSRRSRTALRKRHSTTGWMAVNASFISVWMPAFSSSMLRCTAMAKRGSTSYSLGR